MSTVTSADGTTIDYERSGSGPPLILVQPAIASRATDPTGGSIVGLLDGHHTVFVYDRRGRGASTDTKPSAAEREIEDIAALIAEAGGQAAIFGGSSGGVLATRAALALPGVTHLAVYEPALLVDDSRAPLPDDYVEHLDALIAEDRRTDAVAYFLTVAAGVPVEYVEAMKAEPFWAGMEANAQSIPHDGRVVHDVMRGGPLPEEWAQIDVPALVMAGGEGEQFMVNAARQLAELLPNGRFESLEGQDHGVDPEVLAPRLLGFLA